MMGREAGIRAEGRCCLSEPRLARLDGWAGEERQALAKGLRAV